MTLQLTKTKALRELLIFSLPIIFGQIGLMLIGTGDMIIASKHSTDTLAAIGLAVAIANPIMMIALGLLFGVSPLLAQKRGKGENVDKYLPSVFFLSLAIALVFTIVTILSTYIVPVLDYGPKLNGIIIEYLLISSSSMFGVCLYQGLREYLQSLEKTMAANLIALLGVVVNLYFNYGFVFGAWGLPKLDVAGLAWASLGVRFFMGTALLIMITRKHKVFAKVDWGFCREVLSLSIPIALAVFFEVMAFCSVTLFVGRFGSIQTAANNLALTLGSLTFMIPLSISSAAAVKVGHAYGEKSFSHVKTYILVSLLMSQLFMLISATMYFTIPDFLLGLFTEDTQVIFWGMQLLFLVGLFQFFDGAQVILAGVLRGLSVTRPASIAIFIGYWIIGIPLGYFFAFKQGLESKGMWMGLVVSLAVVSVMLSLILKKRIKALHEEGL